MCCLRMIYESKHVAAIKRVSVKILDYYNITVHWLVCNKLSVFRIFCPPKLFTYFESPLTTESTVVPATLIRIQSPVFQGTRRSYNSTPRVAPIFNTQIVHSHERKLCVTRTRPWTTSWAFFQRSFFRIRSAVVSKSTLYRYLTVHNNSTHHLQLANCPQ